MAGATASTRALTKARGRYTRSTRGSRSLERGLQLLRAFRLGVSVLGNAELAKRTGLPRPTVSRLTRSLVDAGFLAYDLRDQAYRLAPVVLSLAQAFRHEATVLTLATPLMKKVAEGQRINVGLAVADHLEMVYLESVRESRAGIFRRLAAGSRIPMELTSMGRAYLAALRPADRNRLLREFANRHGASWRAIRSEVAGAVQDVRTRGWCVAAWQSGMVALATPLALAHHPVHVLNISFPSHEGVADPAVARHAALLLKLRGAVEQAVQAAQDRQPE